MHLSNGRQFGRRRRIAQAETMRQPGKFEIGRRDHEEEISFYARSIAILNVMQPSRESRHISPRTFDLLLVGIALISAVPALSLALSRVRRV